MADGSSESYISSCTSYFDSHTSHILYEQPPQVPASSATRTQDRPVSAVLPLTSVPYYRPTPAIPELSFPRSSSRQPQPPGTSSTCLALSHAYIFPVNQSVADVVDNPLALVPCDAPWVSKSSKEDGGAVCGREASAAFFQSPSPPTPLNDLRTVSACSFCHRRKIKVRCSWLGIPTRD